MREGKREIRRRGWDKEREMEKGWTKGEQGKAEGEKRRGP
jgi:hypothetical protein